VFLKRIGRFIICFLSEPPIEADWSDSAEFPPTAIIGVFTNNPFA
jgi:hypothetical protein